MWSIGCNRYEMSHMWWYRTLCNTAPEQGGMVLEKTAAARKERVTKAARALEKKKVERTSVASSVVKVSEKTAKALLAKEKDKAPRKDAGRVEARATHPNVLSLHSISGKKVRFDSCAD